MTDTKTTQAGATGPQKSNVHPDDPKRKEAHDKNLAYDPTKPQETETDKRLKELNKRREEEYKQDAADAKKGKQPQVTPQTQGPGGGMAPGSGYTMGPSQEEIESPVQAMRDPRLDQETTNVDSGGDKLQRRPGGGPASIEEKRAWGDKVPEGPAPYSGGVPGSHNPGELPPTQEQRDKEYRELESQRASAGQPHPSVDMKEANKKAETASPKKG